MLEIKGQELGARFRAGLDTIKPAYGKQSVTPIESGPSFTSSQGVRVRRGTIACNQVQKFQTDDGDATVGHEWGSPARLSAGKTLFEGRHALGMSPLISQTQAITVTNSEPTLSAKLNE
jgi:hypothetical protein